VSRLLSIRVWLLLIAIVAVAQGQVVSLGPSNTIVVAAEESVFHVAATNCQRNGVSVDDRLSSGFGVILDGHLRLVTALHGVSGCADLEIQYKGRPFHTETKKVYLKADLVLLAEPPEFHLPGLQIASAVPLPGQSLEAIGYGSTLAINPSRAVIRLGGSNTIRSLVKNNDIMNALRKQGFPDVTAPIINIDSPLTPGDSGCPLIDDSGSVVGIANGNLMQGTSPYSWAFPVGNVRSLIASNDPIPSSSALADVLISEEVGTSVSQVTTTNRAANATITCGVRTFQYRGAQPFARLLATADPFALAHIGVVQSNALARGKPIPTDTTFDVYVDSASGAAFIVPANYTLSVSGADCVAIDALNEIEMRISTDAVSLFQGTSGPAAMFGARTQKSGELTLNNPAFITTPVFRSDGMAIQRFAFFYGFPGQMTPANEGYVTLAWRRDTLLEESTRTLVPTFSANAATNIYLSIASVYATSFSLN
jgi:hypothetical protein